MIVRVRPAIRFLGWVLLGLYVVLGATGLALQFMSGSRPYGDGPPTTAWVIYVAFGIWAIVGAVLIAKRPGNPVSYCYSLVPLCATLVDFTYGLVYFGSVAGSAPLPGTRLAVFWLASSAFLTATYLFAVLAVLFPNGRPASRGWMRVIWAAGLALVIYAIAGILSPDHLLNPISSFWVDAPPFIPNPFDLSANALAAIEVVRWISYGIVLLSFVLSIAQLFIRFRRSHGVERLQLKWIVFASAFVVLGLAMLISSITSLANWAPQIQRAGSFVLGGGIAGIAVASGFAILRYRLFDIDVIIRRTTSYAIVTGLLLLIYFSSVVLLQRVFTAVTGQTSTVAVVLSTLLIAALFLPLRRRVQDIIDRRFFRKKYDAQKTLEDFAATVRDETDLDALTAELVRVIQETMQPEHVTVWLMPEAVAGPTITTEEPVSDT